MVDLLVPPHISRANQEYIALPGLCALPRKRSLDLLNGNLMSGHCTRGRFSRRLFVPAQPVAQHAAAHNPTSLAPHMRAVGNAFLGLGVRQPVVIHACFLVCKVLEAVPLRACLRIDVDLIVVCDEGGEIGEINVLLLEGLAVEAWILHVVQFPVELDRLAGLDFLGCGFDDAGCEQVDCCVLLVEYCANPGVGFCWWKQRTSNFILLPIFVEKSPNAALWLYQSQSIKSIISPRPIYTMTQERDSPSPPPWATHQKPGSGIPCDPFSLAPFGFVSYRIVLLSSPLLIHEANFLPISLFYFSFLFSFPIPVLSLSFMYYPSHFPARKK